MLPWASGGKHNAGVVPVMIYSHFSASATVNRVFSVPHVSDNYTKSARRRNGAQKDGGGMILTLTLLCGPFQQRVPLSYTCSA